MENNDGLRHVDDRVSRYKDNELTQSPKDYFERVRAYWVIGIFFNIIGFLFMGLSIYSSLDKNANSTLNLVRVDGVRISEDFDVRRSVIMKNTLSRLKLKQHNVSK